MGLEMKIEPFVGEPDVRRLIGAMRGEKTDRVPYGELLIEDQHVEKLLGRWAGNTLAVGGDPAKGSAAAEGARPMYPKDYIELCHIVGLDAMLVEAIWTPFKQVRPDGTIGPINDRSIKSRADMDRIIWPGEEDIEERLQYVREYVEAAKGTGIGVIFGGFCMWTTLYELVIGMHDCMIMIMDDRDFFEELMSRSADYFVELAKRAIEAGVDIFFVADDIGLKSGLFVRPEVFEKVWRPPFERVMAPMLEAKKPIMFHSDGKIDEAMEMLIDMGIDSLNPLDPSGIDYRDYKKRYGHRVTLHGNIDLTWPLVSGTPEDVERDVREHAEVLKPGGRWIAASSHSVVNYVPYENFITMVNAIHKYGRY